MKLTTRDNLKIDLGIATDDTSQDSALDRLNDRASSQVEDLVGYPIERGVRDWETALRNAQPTLPVPFLPLHAVTYVEVGGEVWVDDANSVTNDTFCFTPWGTLHAPYGKAFCGVVKIKVESGYTLTDPDRDLPLAFESAVAELVRPLLHSRDRDPNIKTESVPGVASVTYGSDDPGKAGAPDGVIDLLTPYRLAGIA